MEKNYLFIRLLRKVYEKIFTKENTVPFNADGNVPNKLLINKLRSSESLMVARFGGFELATVYNYVGVKSKKKHVLNYVLGKEPAWWWNTSLLESLYINAGVFPNNFETIEKFCELMLNDMQNVNILGSWLKEEEFFSDKLHARKVHLFFLEPFWSDFPWTAELKDKKVLVVHPFKHTILRQYEKRELLFKNKDILPSFASLDVVKAVQSHDNKRHNFSDWFEALEYMKTEIDEYDYDICLIGAGAYGFPLAAHVKRQGKKALHLGGALQLLFGIRGKRWENPQYGVNAGIPYGFYRDMMNEHWVRPNEDETPVHSKAIEGACYW